MNKIVISAVVLLFIMSAVKVYSQDETAGITKTALDYMEGWYQGDAWDIVNTLYRKSTPVKK